MPNDLEFHYIISYREGYGWNVASDVEDAVMTDGTIYDWETHQWFFAFEDADNPEELSIADIDTAHYSVLHSMLRQMNGEY